MRYQIKKLLSDSHMTHLYTYTTKEVDVKRTLTVMHEIKEENSNSGDKESSIANKWIGAAFTLLCIEIDCIVYQLVLYFLSETLFLFALPLLLLLC